LADNVLAALFIPRLSSSEDATGFALIQNKGFSYDSTDATVTNPRTNPKNQLPPVLEVILVCINEESSSTYNWPATAPDFGQANLLDATQITDLTQLQTGLDKFIKDLRDKYRIDARVFRTAVGLKSAKWSTQ
jgi:uncharacterized protein (TIGR02599 family)